MGMHEISCNLPTASIVKSQIDCEGLAKSWGIMMFRPYQVRNKFTSLGDQQPQQAQPSQDSQTQEQDHRPHLHRQISPREADAGRLQLQTPTANHRPQPTGEGGPHDRLADQKLLRMSDHSCRRQPTTPGSPLTTRGPRVMRR